MCLLKDGEATLDIYLEDHIVPRSAIFFHPGFGCAVEIATVHPRVL